MNVASLTRFGLSALASLGIVLGQLTGAAGVAQAEEFGDPWFDEAIMSGLGAVHPTIRDVSPSPSPSPSPMPAGFKPAEAYKPTDTRRIAFDAKAFQVGETVSIQHLAFRPGERIIESTYRYVPGCPNKQCWEHVYEDVYVADRHGSVTFSWDTSTAEPGRYRFCTGGVQGCRSRYAEIELTAVPQTPRVRAR